MPDATPENEHSLNQPANAVDAFIKDVAEKSDLNDAMELDIKAKIAAYEDTVLTAMKMAGMEVSYLSDARKLLAPEDTLVDLIMILDDMLVILTDKNAPSDTVKLNNELRDLCFWALSLANTKVTADNEKIDMKKQEQLRISSDEDLTVEKKMKLLAVINQLYPEEEGLSVSDPEILFEIDDYVQKRTLDAEKRQRVRNLNIIAEASIMSTVTEQNLGSHDNLVSFINTLVIAFSQQYAFQTGEYDENEKEKWSTFTEMMHGIAISQAAVMGWTKEQVDIVIERMYADFKAAEERPDQS